MSLVTQQIFTSILTTPLIGSLRLHRCWLPLLFIFFFLFPRAANPITMIVHISPSVLTTHRPTHPTEPSLCRPPYIMSLLRRNQHYFKFKSRPTPPLCWDQNRSWILNHHCLMVNLRFPSTIDSTNIKHIALYLTKTKIIVNCLVQIGLDNNNKDVSEAQMWTILKLWVLNMGRTLQTTKDLSLWKLLFLIAPMLKQISN